MSVVGEPARERPSLRVALVAADPIRHQGLMAIVRGGAMPSSSITGRRMSSSSMVIASINTGHLPSPWAERIPARRGHYPPAPRRFRSTPRCSPRRPG
jgi:hypothetical protein